MAAEIDLAKFDDAFLGILQHLGRIEPFLEAIFFFLARRTDFFKLMHNRDDKLGFPPGVAEQIVLRIFKKYQKLVLGNEPKKSHAEKSKASEKKDNAKTAEKSQMEAIKIPEAAKIVEVETSVESSSSASSKDLKDSKEASGSSIAANKPEKKPVIQTAAASSAKVESKPAIIQDPDSFNGAITDKYSWAQTHTDVDVKVPVPDFVKKSRDIEVEIKPNKLKVALKNNPPHGSAFSSRIIIDGKMTQRIRSEESFWSLVPGDCLQIHFEKTKDIFWTALLEGEPEIDKTKLDTTRDISEFDEQTQNDFQKVVYDHHQKLQGKPTTEEQKTHDLLKQAWDAEGSPFKGTPFDPSTVNISGGSG